MNYALVSFLLFVLCIGHSFGALLFQPSNLDLTLPAIGGITEYRLALSSKDGFVAGADSVLVAHGQSRVFRLTLHASGSIWNYDALVARVSHGDYTDERSTLLPSFTPESGRRTSMQVAWDTSFVVKIQVTLSGCTDSAFIDGRMITIYERNGKQGMLSQSRQMRIPVADMDSSGTDRAFRFAVSPPPAISALSKMQSEFRITARCGTTEWHAVKSYLSTPSGWLPKAKDSVDLGSLAFNITKPIAPTTKSVTGVAYSFSDRGPTGNLLLNTLGAPSWETWNANNRDAHIVAQSTFQVVEQNQLLAYRNLPWATEHNWGYAIEPNVPTFSGANAFGSSRFVFPFLAADSITDLEAGIIRDAGSGIQAIQKIHKHGATDSIVYPLTSAGTYTTPVANPFRLQMKLAEGADTSFGQVMMSGVKDFYLGSAVLPITINGVVQQPLLDELSVPSGRVTMVLKSTSGTLQNPTVFFRRTGDTLNVADPQNCVAKFGRKDTAEQVAVSGLLLPGTYEFQAFTQQGKAWTHFGGGSFTIKAGSRLQIEETNGELVVADHSPEITILSPAALIGACVPPGGFDVQGFVDGKGAEILNVQLRVNGLYVNLSTSPMPDGKWSFAGKWTPSLFPSSNLFFEVTTNNGVKVISSRNIVTEQASIAFTSPVDPSILVPHSQAQYSLQGRVVSTQNPVSSVTLNGQAVTVDPATGVFSKVVTLQGGANSFTVIPNGVCGTIPQDAVQITRSNTLPSVSLNCATVANKFRGDIVPVSGQSTDPDSDPMASYQWNYLGTQIATTEVTSLTVRNPGNLEFCATDALGGKSCAQCFVDPTYVFRGTCSGSASVCEPNTQQDGPEYRTLYVRHTAEEIYFLVELCQAAAFESDEYLYLNLNSTIGDPNGNDFRIILDSYRPDYGMVVRSEIWDGMGWAMQGTQPRFAYSTDSEKSPLTGTPATKGSFFEIAVARPVGITDFDLNLEGSRFVISDAFHERYTFTGPPKNITIDGRPCEWSAEGCVERDWFSGVEGWTVEPATGNNHVSLEASVTNGGDAKALSLYGTIINPNTGISIIRLTNWAEISGSQSVKLDVRVPSAYSSVGAFTVEITVPDATNGKIIGTFSPTKNSQWATHTINMNLANTTGTNLNASSIVFIRIYSVYQNGSSSDPVRFDNFKLLK